MLFVFLHKLGQISEKPEIYDAITVSAHLKKYLKKKKMYI